jgi:hypothetical protein
LKRCGYKDISLINDVRHHPNEPVNALEVFKVNKDG